VRLRRHILGWDRYHRERFAGTDPGRWAPMAVLRAVLDHDQILSESFQSGRSAWLLLGWRKCALGWSHEVIRPKRQVHEHDQNVPKRRHIGLKFSQRHRNESPHNIVKEHPHGQTAIVQLSLSATVKQFEFFEQFVKLS